MRILGISAFYHDSAAALVVDGEIVAAAQEERFTRVKHDSRFPVEAVRFCLTHAGITLADLDYVVFYEKPFLKFERLLETYLASAPAGLRSFTMAMPLWLSEKLFQRSLLTRELKRIGGGFNPERLMFTEHHQSHAASAFYPSPFKEALVLTMDGVGEWATTSVALGKGNRLDFLKEIHFPHSPGLLYSAFTYFMGFKVNSGEYKVMGLAAYGEPRYADLILDNMLDLKPDGSFRLNMKYFDYRTGLKMINRRFEVLFGEPARESEQPLTQFHMDVAASIQRVLEEVILRMTRSLAAETGMRNLCLAGGVALNCVANGKILRDGRFDALWIQPAAGDAGGAVGAALAAYHSLVDSPRVPDGSIDKMHGSLLGPEFAQPEIEQQQRSVGAVFTVLDDACLIQRCVETLEKGQALGWFQGRMEFGPRALGARSILADARSPTMQSRLNIKVKRRESFRPFAPSVLREDVTDWFDLDCDSPYMLLVADVKKSRRREMNAEEKNLFGIAKLKVVRSEIPAVTHVDYSARIQTVRREMNPRFHALISAFKERTGCPVIVNTSFNVRGEPVVASPVDAFRCCMATEMDALAIGNCFLSKQAQNLAVDLIRASVFELD
jgi:carbamoyltransferase